MHRDYLEEVKKLLNGKDYRVVGKNVRRVDALGKVCGRAKFTTDFLMENTWVVRPVRSPFPHALIRKIDKEAAQQIPRVECVITGEEIRGQNQCGIFIEDRPLITCDKARYVGDIVALVVARDVESVLRAVELQKK